uniref:Uncharacterized protein n=1 Tax=viral metagenome TaxID=1070528 RepID=A0A6M3XH92_9ZZZZ
MKGYVMAKLVKYIGPKRQKHVLWLEERPTWNEGNDFIVEMADQFAAFLIRRCPNIFKIVGVIEKQVIIEGIPEKKAVKTQPDITEEPESVAEPTHDANKLYGTKSGDPFKSAKAAQMQLNRIAATIGMGSSDLEVVEFSDGSWIKKKDIVEETMPIIPDGLEMLPEEEVEPV